MIFSPFKRFLGLLTIVMTAVLLLFLVDTSVFAAIGDISTLAGGGARVGGQATSALINGPRGMGFDSLGNIYISDFRGHRVRKVDILTGIITTVAGTGRPGFDGDGGLAISARVNRPADL